MRRGLDGAVSEISGKDRFMKKDMRGILTEDGDFFGIRHLVHCMGLLAILTIAICMRQASDLELVNDA